MSFVTVDFPDIRESDSAEYAYLANVYNTQTVLREIGRRPALLTAYLSTVINAAADNLPDPRHMDCLF